MRRARRAVSREEEQQRPAPNAELFPAADIPLGSAWEYFSQPLALSAYSVYRAALGADSPLDLLEKRLFARDVLEQARQHARQTQRAPRRRPGGSTLGAEEPVGPIRLRFED